MEFCECGSIKINGNCSNKNCSRHVKKHEPASPAQVLVIKGLLDKLERDYSENTLKKVTSDDAERMIDDLKDELEELKLKKKQPKETDENDADLTEESVEELIETELEEEDEFE